MKVFFRVAMIVLVCLFMVACSDEREDVVVDYEAGYGDVDEHAYSGFAFLIHLVFDQIKTLFPNDCLLAKHFEESAFFLFCMVIELAAMFA
ncbi:hypothetical protein [Paenibacillus sp. WLX2291]|uniref:hypothetical protein n=1 Tax=Paenibacillus sp. WLX2291 TaxID=3296934 RepID=UPI00398400A6